MFTLNIKSIMKERGLKPTAWALRQVGIGQVRANYLLSHKAKAIRFDELEKLCFLLHCTPFELLKIPPEQKDNLPQTHPLQAWVAKPNTQGAIQYLKVLPPEKLALAEELIKKLLDGD